MSIATELTTLNSTKQAIKQALTDKGVDLTGTVFAGYAQKITDLPTGGGSEWTQAYYDSVLANSWTRNPNWLAMPTLATRGFVGLYSVQNTTNEVVALVGIGGAYTVDWGDGVVENFADSVQADHQYTYANVSNDTLQPNGSKQVIVKVYPQVGQSFTSINLNVRFTGRTVTYETQWLDIYLNTDATSTMPQFCVSSGGSINIYMNNVEQILWESGTVSATSAAKLFYNLRNLSSISVPSLSSVTDMSNMFTGCSSLQTIPLLSTAAVTNMSNMFKSCSALQTIPLLNTAAVTNMTYMFQNCYSLQTIPLLNTAAVTSMTYMFQYCYSLQTIPLLNTAAVTSMTYMFQNCSSLQTIPLLNTAAVTSMTYMFQNCSALQTIPLLNTDAVTNMSIMFSGCLSLQEVKLTSANANTNTSNMFSSCPTLSRIRIPDMKITFSVASCRLSATALDEIYTNLPTVTGKTITVTGNFGTIADNPSIATAKGWTVTG